MRRGGVWRNAIMGIRAADTRGRAGGRWDCPWAGDWLRARSVNTALPQTHHPAPPPAPHAPPRLPSSPERTVVPSPPPPPLTIQRQHPSFFWAGGAVWAPPASHTGLGPPWVFRRRTLRSARKGGRPPVKGAQRPSDGWQGLDWVAGWGGAEWERVWASGRGAPALPDADAVRAPALASSPVHTHPALITTLPNLSAPTPGPSHSPTAISSHATVNSPASLQLSQLQPTPTSLCNAQHKKGTQFVNQLEPLGMQLVKCHSASAKTASMRRRPGPNVDFVQEWKGGRGDLLPGCPGAGRS